MLMANIIIYVTVVAMASVLLPQLVFGHLLEDSHGELNAFNFDEAAVAHLNSDCAYRYECQRSDAKDTFFYNCYYDVQSSECQCSTGAFSGCNVSSSSLDAPAVTALKRHYSGNGSVFAFAGGIFGRFSSLPLLAKIIIVADAVVA